MKIVFNLIFLLFCLSTLSFSQGRGDQIFDESYIHEIRVTTTLGIIEMYGLFFSELGQGEFTYTLAELEIDGEVIDSVGIRVKGGLSAFDSKKPLKLDFNRFVSEQKFDGLKKLNLHQGNMDPSFMREAITYSLFRNAGVKTVRTSYAKVYFNGTYEGVYTLVEQIDDNFLKNRFASDAGALYKTGFIGLDLKYAVNNPLPYDEFVQVVNQIPTELLHEQLDEYLDVESFLRFFATEIFVNAVDGPLTVDYNYYIYYEPKSARYVYVPWDYNLSLYGGANHTLFTSSANFLLDRALSNPILRQRYLEIFCQLFQYNFQENRLQDRITFYQELLKDEVPNDPYIHLIGDWDAGIEVVRNVISSRVEALTNEVNAIISSCPQLVNPISPLDLVINEIVASNDADSGITDPNGDTADWIELFNNTSSDISLDGFYLSNDRDALKHWRFPEGAVIAANDYLIIWADRDVNEEGLHVDFKLSKTWEELILSYENGEIIDELVFGDQETNVGFARVPNGVGEFKKQEATFGITNDLSTSLKEDFQELDWRLFPNPVKAGEAFNIRSTTASAIQLQIVNLDGRLLWQEDVNLIRGNNAIQIAASGIRSGAYIVNLINRVTNEMESRKLVLH